MYSLLSLTIRSLPKGCMWSLSWHHFLVFPLANHGSLICWLFDKNKYKNCFSFSFFYFFFILNHRPEINEIESWIELSSLSPRTFQCHILNECELNVRTMGFQLVIDFIGFLVLVKLDLFKYFNQGYRISNMKY